MNRSSCGEHDECDICGPPSPSAGLRLCPDCEDIERQVLGDIALVAAIRNVRGCPRWIDGRRPGDAA
jgi:hypothetical protein